MINHDAERDFGSGRIFLRDFFAVLLQSLKITNERLLGVLDSLLVGCSPSMAPGKRREVGEIALILLVKLDGE